MLLKSNSGEGPLPAADAHALHSEPLSATVTTTAALLVPRCLTLVQETVEYETVEFVCQREAVSEVRQIQRWASDFLPEGPEGRT